MTTLSSIPVFDWDGTTFLTFYVLAYLAALLWCTRNRSVGLRKFDHPNATKATLEDPYEVAYLAGGMPRCLQLAVVRLLKGDSLTTRTTRILKTNRLIVKGPPPADCNDLERTIYSSVSAAGPKGLELTKISELAKDKSLSLQARLAKKGLRPTEAEVSKSRFKNVGPLILLLVVGCIKTAVGISRDKPILFLSLLVILTVITLILLLSTEKKLTPSGEQLLKKMKANELHQRITGNQLHTGGSTGVEPIFLAVALSGIGVAHSYDQALAIDPSFQKEIQAIGHPSATTGGGCGATGCSSGCSSGCGSGCGGGGCGGCGG